MSRIGAWRDLMPQTLTVEPRTGQDRFDVATFGAATTYPCRLVGKRRQIINGTGQIVVSLLTAYLATAVAIGTQDRVTLTTGDTGSTEVFATQPPILSVARYPDQHGQHHVVLYL